MAQMPQETQQYVQTVLGAAPQTQMAQAQAQPQLSQAQRAQAQRQPGMLERAVNAIIPSAQAAPVPQAQPMPQAAPVAPMALPAYAGPGPGEEAQTVSGPMPGQQAAPVTPTAMAAPMAGPAPNSFDEFGTPIYSQAQANLDKHLNTLQQGQGNIGALDQLRNDTTAPAWLREQAGGQAYDLMSQEVNKAKAEKQAETLAKAAAGGDRKAANTIAKELQNQDGSWLKMILLGFISPQMAGEEAIKLGFGNKWTQGMDENGKAALIQVNAKGLPLKGYKNDGTEIATADLVSYTSGVGKWQTSAEFFQDKKGNVYQTQHNDKGQTRIVDVKTGAKYSGAEPLDRLRDTAALNKMEVGQGYRRENINSEVMAALQKKRGSDVMGALADFESNSPTALTNDDRMAFIKQYGGLAVPGTSGVAAPARAAPTQAAPAGAVAPTPVPASAINAPAQAAPAGAIAPTPLTAVSAPAQVQAGGPAVLQNPVQGAGSELPTSPMAGLPGYDASGKPIPVMGEGAKSYQARLKDWQADQDANKAVDKAGKTAIIKESSEIVANAPKFMDQLDTINKAAKLTKEGNNLGRIFQGIIPGEQTVGSLLGTQDAVNTKKIMEAVQLLSAQGMKVLGANPTDADRDYLTKNVPDENWPAEETRKWLEEHRDFIIRKVDIAKKQIKTGGNYMPDMPTSPSADEKLSARDQQALKWANDNPKDPRSADIKKRLGK